SDVLYHYNKFAKRKFDKAIDIWGADHHGYAPRLLAALEVLGIEKEKLTIIITQLVRLVRGGEEFKVSKRAGTFVTIEELVDEVGLDAARFFFLESSLNTHMDFNMDLARERSLKNPIYYVQYAHARLSSILRKSQIPNPKFQTNSKLLATQAELNLIRKLIQFPEVLDDIAANYQAHHLTNYVLELAGEFHNFYERERVITDDKNLTRSRLALVKAVQIVLKNALTILGISAPQKM
ncbi:MAG: arginine--tRNA ligase, partial [Parcubacteria group bacterium]|nr:arginine--tRNA ligase [Parcubacteria group bacterium]